MPMATTSLNIMLRLGGLTMTTLCATFLGWRLSAAPNPASTSDAFAEAFDLLCFLHVPLFLATLRLPWLVPDARKTDLSAGGQYRIETPGPGNMARSLECIAGQLEHTQATTSE
jgi:hypothetical protein